MPIIELRGAPYPSACAPPSPVAANPPMVADPSFGESSASHCRPQLIKYRLNDDNEIPASAVATKSDGSYSIIRAIREVFTAIHRETSVCPAPSHVPAPAGIIGQPCEFARLNTSCTSARLAGSTVSPACKSTYSLPTIRSISTAARSLSKLVSNEKWGVDTPTEVLAKSI